VGRIVVGVDGSDGAIKALGWALDQARARGDAVEVVHVYPPVDVQYPYSLVAERWTDAAAEMTAERERAVRQVLEGLARDLPDDAPVVTTEAVEGRQPARVLAERAQDADLLVVGTRGLGGVGGTLLGSVSHRLVHLAPCPVVVVPTKGDPSS
jgi:nucleotide-binding universal stress UspA family protein